MKYAEKSVLVPYEKYQRLMNSAGTSTESELSDNSPPQNIKVQREKLLGGKSQSVNAAEQIAEEPIHSQPPPPGVPNNPSTRRLYQEVKPERNKKVRSWTTDWKGMKR